MKQAADNQESGGEIVRPARRGTRGKTGQWRTERQMRPKEGNAIRIRVKHLDDVPPEKVALAFWLLARRLVEDRTDGRELNAEEIGKVVENLDESDPTAPADGGAS